MTPITRATALLILAPLAFAASAKHPVDPAHRNFGVDSVHQPVVGPADAQVYSCPNWTSMERDSAALTDSNYGCAINSNLAAMVADPTDLIHGKTDGAADANAITHSIKAWREMDPTSKQWTTTVKESAKGGGS